MGNLKEKLDNYVNKTVNTKSKWFNWKMGTIGGTGSGFITYFFNNQHGFTEGIKGAGNQFTYSFIAAGLTSKLCEYIAKNIENDKLAVAASSIIPTAIAFGANYLWHDYFGTAEPLDSSTWQIPLNILGFGVFGHYWHKQKKREQNP